MPPLVHKRSICYGPNGGSYDCGEADPIKWAIAVAVVIIVFFCAVFITIVWRRRRLQRMHAAAQAEHQRASEAWPEGFWPTAGYHPPFTARRANQDWVKPPPGQPPEEDAPFYPPPPGPPPPAYDPENKPAAS